MAKPTRVVLAIGGSDSSAGAGIQADIKTGAVFGVYTATAITAVTAQGPAGVRSIAPLATSLIAEQIAAVRADLPVHAVKLGMVYSPEILAAIWAALADYSGPVVLDPVLVASAGNSLAAEDLVAALVEALPRVTLITPNLSEASQLLGRDKATDFEMMRMQVRALSGLGARAVLLKGGHLPGPKAADLLLSDGIEYPYTAARIDTSATHGTGCSLASAVAAGLAQGLALPQAVAAAKSFIQGAIRASDRLQLAPENGPVHQLYEYW